MEYLFHFLKIVLIIFICFGLFVYFIHEFFFPYYKNVLREKIREYIIQSRLDNSGKQIKKNMVESDRYLLIFQSIEKLFGLDYNPLISTITTTEESSKCIFAS